MLNYYKKLLFLILVVKIDQILAKNIFDYFLHKKP